MIGLGSDKKRNGVFGSCYERYGGEHQIKLCKERSRNVIFSGIVRCWSFLVTSIPTPWTLCVLLIGPRHSKYSPTTATRVERCQKAKLQLRLEFSDKIPQSPMWHRSSAGEKHLVIVLNFSQQLDSGMFVLILWPLVLILWPLVLILWPFVLILWPPGGTLLGSQWSSSKRFSGGDYI